MTTLVFLATVAAVIITVLAFESQGEQVKFHQPAGLFTWLTRGNWPAKVGGALVIVGVGALLRYAAIHIDIAPHLKLYAGIFIALALGAGSLFVPDGPAKRPVSLALGGAAFGVAYLTAYSAFALFEYLDNPMGLALLGLTAVGAGVFAVTRSALSVALLAMVGAYLAPAFAVQDPGPLVVYGYYAGASLLTLAMVAARGWRPLIHLSFLFTLAGGVFFAWTSQYYTDAHAGVMLPMVLLLAAIHVAMPIAEKGQARAGWIESLDAAYLLSLPSAAALLVLVIAPTSVELSNALLALAVIWALGGTALRARVRPGAEAHAVIAAVLAVLGIAARFRNLPWELLCLGISSGALALAAWRVPTPQRLHSVLAGLVLLFGAVHVLSSIAATSGATAFANSAFVERILAAALLIWAGFTCRRIRQSLDTLLLVVGFVWAFVAIGIELVRWELATLALVVHWFLILVAASLWIPGRRLRAADRNVSLLSLLILLTAVWASRGAAATAAWLSLCGAALALIGAAVKPRTDAAEGDRGLIAALFAPAVAAVWAARIASVEGIDDTQFIFTVAALTAILALLAGRSVPAPRGEWVSNAADTFGVGFGIVLGFATLLAIARNPWAVALEIACLAGLALVIAIRRAHQRPTDFSIAACMIGVALVLQANLMRLLGPPGTLDIGDVLRLEWPAVISLLWAAVGCALTIWSRRVASRTVWVSGAALLVAAAVKLLLIDFGSLGQLGNILAVIAAGGVFLLVGWLAPMPPAPAESTRSNPPPGVSPQPPPNASASGASSEPRSTTSGRESSAWTYAAVLVAGAIVYVYGQNVVRSIARTADRPSVAASPAPEPSAPVVPEFRSAPPAPAEGEAGLDQLLREGRLRKATPRDIDAWASATGSKRRGSDYADPRSGGQFAYRTYVVLGEMTFPARLTGAHSATFIVPRGVPRPYGDPGHSTLLEMP